MRQHRQFIHSPAFLWPLIALVGFGALGALVPIGPLDFWWHMAIGRDIASAVAVPRFDTYSWTLPPNTPFFYQSWLSEWLFFELQQIGGLTLIVVVRNVLLLAAYGLIGLDAWRRSRSSALVAVAIVGAGLLTLNNLTVRPQMFSWLPFALIAALLGAFRANRIHRRSLLIVPLVMAVWVNLHGAFAIGCGLIALTILSESLRFMFRRRTALDRHDLAWLWLIGLLSGLALMINPRGIGVIGYVGNLIGNPAVRQLVIEWQAPRLDTFPGFFVPLLPALTILLWLLRRDRVNWTDALLLGAFTWLAWSSARNLIWLGMVAWPILTGLLTPRSTGRIVRHRPAPPLLGYGVASMLLLPLLIVQPPFKAALNLPPVFGGLGVRFPEGALIDQNTPVQAVAWLQQHPLPADARVFNDMGFGSYLMWALPQVRVAADPRIELYPLAFWQRYRQIMRNENARAQLQELGATHLLLSRAGQPELIADLAAPNSGWTQQYADDTAVFFARSTTGTSK